MNKRQQDRKRDFIYDRNNSDTEELDSDAEAELELFEETWSSNIALRLRDCLRQLSDDGMLFNVDDFYKTEEYHEIEALLIEGLFIVHK